MVPAGLARTMVGVAFMQAMVGTLIATALVSAIFVVGEDGKPEIETLQFLSSSDSAFMKEVRRAIEHWSFYPADLNGRKVAQVVQETFDFGLPGDPPRGNVIIRTMLERHDGSSH